VSGQISESKSAAADRCGDPPPLATTHRTTERHDHDGVTGRRPNPLSSYLTGKSIPHGVGLETITKAVDSNGYRESMARTQPPLRVSKVVTAIRLGLTRLGVLSSHPAAFAVLAIFALLWIVFG
jgi:hypothetical protein